MEDNLEEHPELPGHDKWSLKIYYDGAMRGKLPKPSNLVFETY
jgi:hypothetical protein